MLKHRVRLTLSGVGRGDGVDDALGLLVANLLVVLDDVAQMVTTVVVSLAHAHRVVRKVHIAVIAWRVRRVLAEGQAARCGGFAETYKRVDTESVSMR